jgi:hypothetical protein
VWARRPQVRLENVSDPTWARVLLELENHARILFGAGLGLVASALFVRVISRSRRARVAAAWTCLAAAPQLLLGGFLLWLPRVSTVADAPELRAAYRQVELAALVLGALSLVALVACLRRSLSGVRFAVVVAALGLAAQAVGLELGARARLAELARADALRAIERRAIQACIALAEQDAAQYLQSDFHASAIPDTIEGLGVERVFVRTGRSLHRYPFNCFASSREVWCFRYGTDRAEPLEKLVREYAFTDAARRMGDAELVEWVAFALGLSVWQEDSARKWALGHGGPARVQRKGSRVSIDFWEQRPVSSFGVRLRQIQVVLDVGRAYVSRGPMGEPLEPDWSR